MLQSSELSRYRSPVVIAFFVVGQLLAEFLPAFANFWAFLSPIEWVSSLTLVITGDIESLRALTALLTLPESGALGMLVRCVEAGAIGGMLVHSLGWIVGFANRISTACGLLFQLAFMPIWFSLISYKPLVDHVAAFAAATAPLDTLAPELRRHVGLGIIVTAIALPVMVIFGARLLSTILYPEKDYS